MVNPSATNMDRIGTLTKKSCNSCHQELPLTEFYQRKDRPDGRHYRCRHCESAYYKAWLKKTHGKDVKRRHENKRRALKLTLPHVAYTAQEIYERDAGVCLLCGFEVPRDDYHIEHIVPLQVDASLLLSYGITEHPGDVPWNVSVAHPACNSSKGNRMTQEDAANYALLQHLYKE